MAITVGSVLQFSLTMALGASRVMNVYTYEVAILPGPASGEAYGEAWWNHVKADYRALSQTAAGPAFLSVLIRELSDPTGILAEFAIPPGEQTGTRPLTSGPGILPAFNAAGMRLTVDSRVTRPGQKRIPFLTEADANDDSLAPGFIALVDSLGATVSTRAILGAPALGVALDPVVVGLNPDGTIRAKQNVTGWVTNPYVTSQVSRKRGRGV